jgi:hypothetical protein
MMSQRFDFELVAGPPGHARGDADAASAARDQDDRAAAQRRRCGGGLTRVKPKDARVLITGAGSGIGAATALRYAKAGRAR